MENTLLLTIWLAAHCAVLGLLAFVAEKWMDG